MAVFVASQAGNAKNLRTYPSGAYSSYLWGKLLASLGFHVLLPTCLLSQAVLIPRETDHRIKARNTSVKSGCFSHPPFPHFVQFP